MFDLITPTASVWNISMFGFAGDQSVQRLTAPFCIHPAATASFLSAAARMITAERYAIQPTLRINFKKGP